MKKVLPVFTIAAFFALPVASTAYAGEGHSCEQPVQECLNSMVSKMKGTGFIGVELDEQKAKHQLIVTKVVEGSPAEQSGLRIGDELYALNGITYNKENHAAIAEFKKPGNEVTCTIIRNGAKKKIKMTLVPMPADLMAKYIGDHMMSHAKSLEITTAKK